MMALLYSIIRGVALHERNFRTLDLMRQKIVSRDSVKR